LARCSPMARPSSDTSVATETIIRLDSLHIKPTVTPRIRTTDASVYVQLMDGISLRRSISKNAGVVMQLHLSETRIKTATISAPEMPTKHAAAMATLAITLACPSSRISPFSRMSPPRLWRYRHPSANTIILGATPRRMAKR
jgi:hypothetical protein